MILAILLAFATALLIVHMKQLYDKTDPQLGLRICKEVYENTVGERIRVLWTEIRKVWDAWGG
jgi:hypothetical protein